MAANSRWGGAPLRSPDCDQLPGAV